MIKGDDLAICYATGGLLCRKGADQFGVFFIQQSLISRKKLQVAAAAEDKTAFTVELAFEQPSRREKGPLINVVSMGDIHAACEILRRRARTFAGSASSGEESLLIGRLRESSG